MHVTFFHRLLKKGSSGPRGLKAVPQFVATTGHQRVSAVRPFSRAVVTRRDARRMRRSYVVRTVGFQVGNDSGKGRERVVRASAHLQSDQLRNQIR